MKYNSLSFLFRSAPLYLPLCLGAPACSNSEFGGGPKLSAQQDGMGTGGKTGDGKNPLVNKSGTGEDDPNDPNNPHNPNDPNDPNDPKNPNDPNNPNNPGSVDPNNPKIAGTTLEGLIACLKKKASNYNVVIVLDNSGSQNQTDSTKVRRAVSLDFVTRFNQLVSRKPDTKVQISLVSFADTATPSNWVRLDGKDDPASGSEPIDTLRNAIESATNSPKGGTKYGPAFDAAGNLLRSVGAASLDANTKNYVLFMTDGEPNPGDTYTVPGVSSNIVDQNKAAILSIASGSQISASGVAKVQELALPQTGALKGGYYRAATPETMKETWDKIFVDLIGCK